MADEEPTEVNLTASPEDRRKITAIAERYTNIAARYGDRPKAVRMDITAAHLNGCTLDLDKLLGAPDHVVGHDVGGIQRFLDRRTGALTGHFLPRCAAPEGASL